VSREIEDAGAELVKKTTNFFVKAETAFGEGDFRAAAEMYLKSIDALPTAMAWFNRGVCLQRLNNLAGAKAAFEQAVVLARENNIPDICRLLRRDRVRRNLSQG